MARVNFAALATEKVEDVPGQSKPTFARLNVEQIVPSPLNPRSDFGTAETLLELGESMRVRQLQPLVVTSRTAYLKLFPEHADQIGDVDFVIANGERRWRAAGKAGLNGVDAMIREDITVDRAAFLDALFSENIDRKEFNPIEEALAVESMVRECGSGDAAAERFRRAKSWVSQRRALLKLAPELQEKVRTKELPVRIARSISGLPHEEQEREWQAVREREAAAKVERRKELEAAPVPKAGPVLSPRPSEDRTGAGTGVHPVKDASVVAERPEPTEVNGVHNDQGVAEFTAVNSTVTVTKSGEEGVYTPTDADVGVPDSRQLEETFPWASPEALVVLIRVRMTPEDIARLAELLLS